VRPDLLSAPLCESSAPKDAGESEQIRLALCSEAYHFLLGGGRVSLTEWSTLSAESREALASAGDALRREAAQLVHHHGPAASPPAADPVGAALDRAAAALAAGAAS
jgi:hypothetical protein